MSDITSIDGFLTLEKGARTLLVKEPLILKIGGSADKENWEHKWYIENVPFPVSLGEAIAMFDTSLANLDSEDTWFDVAFAERNGTRTFTGKALIHRLAYAGVRVGLQGATELVAN